MLNEIPGTCVWVCVLLQSDTLCSSVYALAVRVVNGPEHTRSWSKVEFQRRFLILEISVLLVLFQKTSCRALWRCDSAKCTKQSFISWGYFSVFLVAFIRSTKLVRKCWSQSGQREVAWKIQHVIIFHLWFHKTHDLIQPLQTEVRRWSKFDFSYLTKSVKCSVLCPPDSRIYSLISINICSRYIRFIEVKLHKLFLVFSAACARRCFNNTHHLHVIRYIIRPSHVPACTLALFSPPK